MYDLFLSLVQAELYKHQDIYNNINTYLLVKKKKSNNKRLTLYMTLFMLTCWDISTVKVYQSCAHIEQKVSKMTTSVGFMSMNAVELHWCRLTNHDRICAKKIRVKRASICKYNSAVHQYCLSWLLLCRSCNSYSWKFGSYRYSSMTTGGHYLQLNTAIAALKNFQSKT